MQESSAMRGDIDSLKYTYSQLQDDVNVDKRWVWRVCIRNGGLAMVRG